MLNDLRELLELADRMEGITNGLAIDNYTIARVKQSISDIRTRITEQLLSEEAALWRSYNSAQIT